MKLLDVAVGHLVGMTANLVDVAGDGIRDVLSHSGSLPDIGVERPWLLEQPPLQVLELGLELGVHGDSSSAGVRMLSRSRLAA